MKQKKNQIKTKKLTKIEEKEPKEIRKKHFQMQRYVCSYTQKCHKNAKLKTIIYTQNK